MILTDKEKELILCVKKYYKKHNFSPTLAEIAIELGQTRQAVFKKIKNLEKKGVISTIPKKTRSIKIRDGIKL